VAEDRIGNTINWDHPAACKARIIDPDRGLIDWNGRTKLAIVGFASSSKDKAPYEDPEWVVWGLNQLYRHINRADAWIDIHHDYAAEAKVVEGTDFMGWLTQAPIPIFMCKREADIPSSVRYPLEEITAKFGARYFTSTISYMIAYGIYAGFREIGLWGVDLIVGKEYFHQKPCAEFWLGMANAMGIQVRLADESALLKSTHLYGFEEGPVHGPIKIGEIEERLAKMDKRKEELIRELQTVDGAQQDCRYWLELAALRLRGGAIPAL